MPNNTHPRKMSTSRGSCLNEYQTYSWYLESINLKYFFGCTVYPARKCTFTIRQVFESLIFKTNMLHTRFSDIANLSGYSV